MVERNNTVRVGLREGTGRGGYHKIYYPLMDEKGYLKYLLKTMVESMMRDFPEETREVLKEYKIFSSPHSQSSRTPLHIKSIMVFHDHIF